MAGKIIPINEGGSVEIVASFDPMRDVIKVHGDGSGQITFQTDTTQLAKILTAFAEFTGEAITLKLTRALHNGERKAEEIR